MARLDAGVRFPLPGGGIVPTDPVLLLMTAIGGLALVGLIAGWFIARGYTGLGSFLRGPVDPSSSFSPVMPWPHGVQEEYDVHWHVQEETAKTVPAARTPEAGLEFDIEPGRPVPLAVRPRTPKTRLRR
jgi:hypothetical protein